MLISTPQVQKFLLELIDTATYPGKIVEFVSAVKQEVLCAQIERPVQKPSSDALTDHNTAV